MRHELKHEISYEDYLVIRSRLKHLVQADSHAGDAGVYRVRSLYFDNFSDQALREKLDGVDRREKFRIRYYNDDTDYIRLEKKSKIHGLCDKQSAVLTKEEVINICHGKIDFLAKADHALLQEFYGKMKCRLLRPKTVVDYQREPYIYAPSNVRITFDSDIRTSIYQNRLFEEELLTAPTQSVIIMEVKYDAFLPEIIRLAVQVPCRKAGAFSKYAVSRMYG